MAKKGAWTDASAGGEGAAAGPFAKLQALRGALPASAASEATGASPASGASGASGASVAPTKKGPARAVVRLERKGRGGKDATIVAGLGLPAAELEAWLKALKGQLGCGGGIEGDELVLQGDLRKRVGPLLEARGVRKVILGG